MTQFKMKNKIYIQIQISWNKFIQLTHTYQYFQITLHLEMLWNEKSVYKTYEEN